MTEQEAHAIATNIVAEYTEAYASLIVYEMSNGMYDDEDAAQLSEAVAEIGSRLAPCPQPSQSNRPVLYLVRT